MRYPPIAIATALLFTGAAADATPTISGNTISWPDDGWYQVQLIGDDGITEICNGGRSCEVPGLGGPYIVINHTTGKRYEDIVVMGEPVVDGVTVTGNTVSWPDDGWYQVQNADTYDSVCEGGRTCEVSNGSYTIINHSTGERFENVVVGDNDQTGIVISGNTISWPDDGWYQVQDAETYDSVCEGGRSCVVESGVYVVINHSTVERFENIQVDGTSRPSSPSVPLDSIREDLLNELVGYQSESLAEKLYELAVNVETTSTAVELTGTIISNDVVSFTDASTRNSFDCRFGGTLIRESISTDESEGAVTQSGRYDSYEFDQCVTAINGGSLPDGNYELNGNYTYASVTRSSSSGAIQSIVTTWDAFKLIQVDGVTYELGGTLALGRFSNTARIETTRDSQIVRYAESSSDTTTLELTDADFFQNIFNLPPLGGTREVRINGAYTGPLSQDVTLQVNTDPEFTESDGVSGDEVRPLSGSLQISSTDGGVLTMTANGPLTISFLGTDGTTSETILEELPEFDLRGPGCAPDGGSIATVVIEACSF